MSMTEEKAIEIIDKMIKSYIEADECGLSNNDFKHEIEAMQTVLNVLKEKDKEIESIRYIKNNFDYVVQKEIEKKDKIIDLIINEFYKRAKISKNCYIQKSKGIEDCLKHKNCKECIKQYFKSKAEKE